MITYIADTETNGLLDDLDTIHSLVLRDADSGELVGSYHDAFDETLGCRPSIQDGLEKMNEADVIVGHNWIKFDAIAIPKVYPDFKPTYIVRDTLLLSRLQFPELKQTDFKRFKKGTLPGQFIGRYSLESWGHRLGLHKGDYSKEMKAKGLDPWAEWNIDMQEYCELDTEVTFALLRLLYRKPYAEQAVDLEHRFAEVIALMERQGFPFDVKAASALFSDLTGKQASIEEELMDLFPPDEVPTKSHWWVVNNDPAMEYATKKEAVGDGHKASTVTRGRLKTKTIPFNPGSRDMIAARLTRKYKWKPREFTPAGKPKIDETVLGTLPFPEAKTLTQYLMLDKRIGQLATGNQALLKKVGKDGKIHGRVETVGAVTRRCTHSNPNVAQTPKVGSEYGLEFRSLFTAVFDYILVGCDASGIELRMLGHYMAKYDGGKYIKAVVEGTEANGTDVHSLNAKALGLEPRKIYALPGGRTATGRDLAKTFIYAFLYGAGDAKLGSIIGKGAKEGRQLKARFLKAFPALKRLKKAIDLAVTKSGSLNALDGGRLVVRHKHAALNTLLQSAGAVIVKMATVLWYESCIAAGYEWGTDFALVAHIHDELQILTRKELADDIGKLASAAMRDAGEHLGSRCPTAGAYKVGGTWADTH